MLYIIWMVVLTAVAALLFTARRNLPEISAYRQSKVLHLAALLKSDGALIVILALMVFITLFASVHQVPAGHIGVVYEFGGIKGQIGEGLQFVAPWRDVLLANIQVQRRVFDKLSAFSEESQDVFVTSTEKELSPYSIEVVDLVLDNIDFNPEFKKAIEDKQIATQRALEEQQKIEGGKAQGAAGH